MPLTARRSCTGQADPYPVTQLTLRVTQLRTSIHDPKTPFPRLSDCSRRDTAVSNSEGASQSSRVDLLTRLRVHGRAMALGVSFEHARHLCPFSVPSRKRCGVGLDEVNFDIIFANNTEQFAKSSRHLRTRYLNCVPTNVLVGVKRSVTWI